MRLCRGSARVPTLRGMNPSRERQKWSKSPAEAGEKEGPQDPAAKCWHAEPSLPQSLPATLSVLGHRAMVTVTTRTGTADQPSGTAAARLPYGQAKRWKQPRSCWGDERGTTIPRLSSFTNFYLSEDLNFF